MHRESSTRLPSWDLALSGFIVLNLLDMISTWLALEAGLSEGNFLAAALIRGEGLEGLFAFKLLAVALAAGLVLDQGYKYPRLLSALRKVNWALGLVVFSNTAQILLA